MVEKLRKIIEEILGRDEKFDLESGEFTERGHFSTNAAFVLAKKKGISPLEAAEELKRRIEIAAPVGFISRLRIAGPGFLNFWLASAVFQEEVKEIVRLGKNYGRMKIKGLAGRKIQLEFVSANPTGPLTMANGRGGFLGDVLGNVLEAAGAKVEREYYVNDTGNQILALGKSILATLGIIEHEETFYQGDYVKDWAERNKPLVKKMASSPEKLGERASADFLKDIKLVLKSTGVVFDRYTSERKQVVAKKLPDQAMTLFKKKGLVYESEGAVWLKTTALGDDKDRVLVTKDGHPTYFLDDAGHYLETKKRGFVKKINILGPDHYGYVNRIQVAASIIGLKESEVIVTQAVRVMEGGVETKMSKRRGRFITFNELVEEVGPDVIRFFFLTVSPDTHLTFDLELAKKKANDNPVYYTQYAYVRARRVWEKAKKERIKLKNLKGDVLKKTLSSLESPADRKLILYLSRFPELVALTAKDYGVHRFSRYAEELARAFHNFYERERVLGEPREILFARLYLIQAALVVFKNLFDLLGLSAPEKM